jgi:hypothetical protein
VRSSKFTTKAATLYGDSEEFVPSPFVVAFCPVVTRTRVLVHEVAADAVLIAHHLSKLGANLVTALARLNFQYLA